MLLTPNEAQEYLEVIAQYHTKSSITFSYESNEFKKTLGMIQINSPQEKTNNDAKNPTVGGLGITTRSIEEINRLMPYVADELLQEKGKILFLGNGLSCAPLSVAENNPTATIIINDIFDYILIQQDLHNISKGLRHNELIDIFAAERHAVKAINAYIRTGQIHCCNYQFGKNNLPEELLDARLAINCHGPPFSTLDEQLQTLTIGGKLFRTRQQYNEESYPTLDSQKFHTRHFESFDRTYGYCITRLQ